MKKIFLLLAIGLSLSAPASAMETRFSAMVSDVETGLILTADRIDSPRDPSLLGRLATLTMAIQDMADGSVQGSEIIPIGQNSSTTLANALEMTAMGTKGYRAHMTGVVNRIGQNARVYGLRLDAVGDLVGLQATAMRVVRGQDGGPDFEGYTTSRDMVRMAVSASRAFPNSFDAIFSSATGHSSSTHIWLYEDGMCLLSANGPVSGRKLVALLTGAPDQEACFETAVEMISQDDERIAQARRNRD